MCVCVCVRERERKRKRKRDRERERDIYMRKEEDSLEADILKKTESQSSLSELFIYDSDRGYV